MRTPVFRDFLADLDASGRLLHLTKEVSPSFEAAALMKKTQGKRPMLFERVAGSGIPMACGIGGTRELIAESVGCDVDGLDAALASAIVNPIPPVVTEGPVPVQQTFIEAPFELDRHIPVLSFYEKDCAPFVISGLMIVKSEDGTKSYTSVRRMQCLGGSRLTVLITSREMSEQLARFERRHEPLEIAVVFGVVPATLLASQLSTHLYDCDKLAVAGGLLGGPIPMARCRTVDIEVPADAEVVLEGKVIGWQKATEGPFGEMGGYYGGVSERPILDLTCMTCRRDPIMQMYFPSGFEEKLPMGIAREVGLLTTIRQTVPGVCRAYITPATLGRLHAVIQIHKEFPFDGRQAALAAFAADKDLKHVVVVDDDIDPTDPEQVEWAIATRLQADRDVFIVPGCNGSPLEPSHLERGVSAKMGLDATYPHDDERFLRTRVPGEDEIQLEDYL